MSNVKDLNLSIDENNLLNEWKGQATLMLDYGIQLADAMQEQDESSNALSVVKAKLDAEIRANPEQCGIGKTTEAHLAATVLLQPAYTLAEERKNGAVHQ